MVGAFALACFFTAAPPPREIRTASAAATLAAKLANDRADAVMGVRPFRAAAYRAVFRGRRWCWGKVDLAAPGGLSASVSFARTGTAAEVQLHLQTDWREDAGFGFEE